jgi:hypothetical protein
MSSVEGGVGTISSSGIVRRSRLSAGTLRAIAFFAAAAPLAAVRGGSTALARSRGFLAPALTAALEAVRVRTTTFAAVRRRAEVRATVFFLAALRDGAALRAPFLRAFRLGAGRVRAAFRPAALRAAPFRADPFRAAVLPRLVRPAFRLAIEVPFLTGALAYCPDIEVTLTITGK